jgi:leucyl-tRNA synthetase
VEKSTVARANPRVYNQTMSRYDPKAVEAKWQETWQKNKQYDFSYEAEGEPYYDLVELPYPSGDLHLGHWFAFVPPDAFARFKKMSGYNVFFPMGFDAFGLPAENAAIKRSVHPKDWTESNIETMTNQFKTMGTMLAWNQEVITCEPKYYGWNQWIFLKMFEKGLAYRGSAISNWCPVDQTVLANENIEAGKCWRCGNEVVQKEIEQWFLKITDYADKLIWTDDAKVDWPKPVRVGQNNWIGKSQGVTFRYKVKDLDIHFEMYDSVPQTFMAQTFTVMAPEHPAVIDLVKGTKYEKDVMAFVEKIKQKKAGNKFQIDKEVDGVFTGRYIEYTPTGKLIPIWLASFVIYEYGTGVVNASAHDERDFAFAKKYNLELHPVMFPPDAKEAEKVKNLEYAYHHAPEGILQEPKEFKGRRWGEVREDIIKFIEKNGYGKGTTQFHLHDWSISRQRYWGTPVPIIHCDDCGMVPVPEKDLPIELPYDVDFMPKGKPPLASNDKWLKVKCPKCGKDAKRDAETLDTFFDSSWYFFRYLDPDYAQGPFDTEKAKKLTPVDVYFGGAEHTLGHTLYARFFTKFFKDLGLVDFDEFALKRVQHGVILGPDGNRMSKSKGNVVNPDDLVKEYGADTVRLYLSFMMPYIETTAPFDPGAIGGIYRFLKRIWELYEKVGEDEPSEVSLHNMNKTIKKVTEDLG